MENFNNSIENLIMDGARIGLVDKFSELRDDLKPKFVYNNYIDKKSVLEEIERELEISKNFWFSVAFITETGIANFKQTFLDLKEKGVRGRILTTRYLAFNKPKIFQELLKFENIDVRVFEDELHTKGYMFHRENGLKTIIIGSSNISLGALRSNLEWNLKINSTEQGKLFSDIDEEFEKTWEASIPLTYEWIEDYKRIYRNSIWKTVETNHETILQEKLTPNYMQLSALDNLKELRKNGKNKALLISSTGTGKTYLSAFDVKASKAKKVLFVAHREQILRQSRNSFEKIMPRDMTSGILSGNTRYKDMIAKKDMIFATVQTLSKDENIQLFNTDYFDYIVIDETHRAAASSYSKIFDYFNPKFLLGMTATPERTDDLNIYELFDYNIAYEIRLKDALEYNLLCPFYYYGISDFELNGETIDDFTEFNLLVSDQRVDHITEKIEYYGYSGDRVKGLIFCSRVEEAKELSYKLNERGYRTVALDGSTNDKLREEYIDRLESDGDNYIEYIITVDIFNEGVDIPAVNQVVMLRPTQSSIIFIQQLGRGLRKYNEKKYVTVIDFIGNYSNNYMIPIALSGDKKGQKDEIRRTVRIREIEGFSRVDFDEITRHRIMKSIDEAQLNQKKLYVEDYNNVKAKLGRIPNILELSEHGNIDPVNYFAVGSPLKYKENNKSRAARTYTQVIRSLEEDYKSPFNNDQELMLENLYQKVANGKRAQELVLLKYIIEENDNFINEARRELNDMGLTLSDKELDSSIRVLSAEFEINKLDREKFSEAGILTITNYDSPLESELSDKFRKFIKNENFKEEIKNLIAYGLNTYETMYSNNYKDTNFSLNKTYTYEDVFRLLNWEKNMISLNVGGYKYDEDTNTFPVFINYHKTEDISDTIDYEDEFISNQILKAISKSGRNLGSDDVLRIYDQDKNNMKIYLFIRRSSDIKGAKDFYFLGEMYSIGEPIEITMANTNVSAVELFYELDVPVNKATFDYLTKED